MPIPKHNDSLRPQSAKDIVYQTIRQWIIEGDLTPGERLSDEELSQHFSVSRTPIREAFQILETQKLIRVLPGKATVVAELDLNNIKNCYLPLARLQALAAELACDRVTADQIITLKKLNQQCSIAKSGTDVKQIIEADDQFHYTILNIAGNEMIMEFCSVLISHVRRAEYQFYRAVTSKRQSAEEHNRIIQALEKCDRTGAGTAMQENWLSTVYYFEQITGQQNSRG